MVMIRVSKNGESRFNLLGGRPLTVNFKMCEASRAHGSSSVIDSNDDMRLFFFDARGGAYMNIRSGCVIKVPADITGGPDGLFPSSV